MLNNRSTKFLDSLLCVNTDQSGCSMHWNGLSHSEIHSYSQSLRETDFCFPKEFLGFLFSKEGRMASALDWILYVLIVRFNKTCKCGWTQRKPHHFLLDCRKSHWRGDGTLTWYPLQCCSTQTHRHTAPPVLSPSR